MSTRGEIVEPAGPTRAFTVGAGQAVGMFEPRAWRPDIRLPAGSCQMRQFECRRVSTSDIVAALERVVRGAQT